MVFWLAVLVGALFAWIAVRVGFFTTWIAMFHFVLAAYLAIFLAPTAVACIPAATAIPDYGYALTVLSVAVASLLLSFGTCYVCISGRLNVEFPPFFDKPVAGFWGFLSGFFVWSFLAMTFSLTPLPENEPFKRLGFDAASQQTNIGYVCWWCDRLHTFVSPFGDETTARGAVALLTEKSLPQTSLAAKPEEAAPQAPAAPTPVVVNGDGNAKKETDKEPDKTASAGPEAPAPLQPVATPVGDAIEQKLGRHRLTIYAAQAAPAAIADPAIRIIEVDDTCRADQFSAGQAGALRKWVSNGGVLWARNDVLSLFDCKYSKLPQRDTLTCEVSQSPDVASIVSACKQVPLSLDAVGKMCIRGIGIAKPLLMTPGGGVNNGVCWSIVPFGKGWISDPKPIDTTQRDGKTFWDNFCRFCLDASVTMVSSTPAPPVEPALPVIPSPPPVAKKSAVDDKLKLHQMTIYTPQAIAAAVANSAIRILEVDDACRADQFSSQQIETLRNWVSAGGVLWLHNDVLSLFELKHSPSASGDKQVDCEVSSAAEVAPIAGLCKRVTLLPEAGGRSRIQDVKDTLPLLTVEGDNSPAGVCWSLAPYGRGWVSDPKPVDLERQDGKVFWENFCRFCLGEAVIVAPRGGRPYSQPVLAGTWRSSRGAKFSIEDSGKTLVVTLAASDTLSGFTGTLTRNDKQEYEGIVDATFRADATKQFPIYVSVAITDRDHLEIRCAKWPGVKGTLSDTWTRLLDKYEGPLTGTWKSSGGARFTIEDDGKNVVISLMNSDTLTGFSGNLTRRNERSLEGTISAMFRMDPQRQCEVRVTATLADPNHLELHCTRWPIWNAKGKYLGNKGAIDETWMRAKDDAADPPKRVPFERPPARLPTDLSW